MPIDPSIPLAAKPPDLAGGVSAGLGTVGAFLDIQSKSNQLRQQQNTFLARQRAGQILSTSDPSDPDSQVRALMTDPQVAPFAGEIIGQIRGAQQTLTQIQGEQQKQAQTGLEAVFKSLPAIMANPSAEGWDKVMGASLGTLSPTARARVAPAIDSLRSSLTDGLPSDARSAGLVFNQRLTGLMLAGGVTPDAIKALTGTPTTQDVGGAIKSGVQMPPQLGGAFVPAGQQTKSLSPAEALTTEDVGVDDQGRPLKGTKGQVGAGITQLGVTPGIGATGNAFDTAKPVATAGTPTSASPYFTGRIADFNKYEADLDNSVITNQTGRRNMQEIVDAAKEAQFGGGASAYMKLGQLLQAIGVNNKSVDQLSNGSLPASQVGDKVSLGNAMNSLRQQLPPGSRANLKEFQAYLEKNPNISTDPRAMVQVFNYWNSLYDRDVAEQQALDKYKESGGDLTRWPAKWAASDYMKNFAPTTPFSGEGVKGIPAQIPQPLQGKNGLHWSEKRQQFRDASGALYDKSGKPVSQ